MAEIENRSTINKGDIFTGAKLFALTSAHTITEEALKFTYNPSPESPLGYLLYNGGNFFNGYSLAWGTRRLIEIQFPNVSEKWKNTLSMSAAATGLAIAESGLFNLPFLGVPDPLDMPAGLLGAACCLGVSLWLERNKSKPALQTPATS